MKLTTKRNRRYFFRELFSYMIPSILIVGSIDVFYHFMQCPLHPEWSAPCSINWILAAIYGIFLIITIILAIISANALRKVKKKIENEFLESINPHEGIVEKKDNKKSEQEPNEMIKYFKEHEKQKGKPKRIIVNSDSTLKNKSAKKSTKKTAKSEKVSTKKKIAKK